MTVGVIVGLIFFVLFWIGYVALDVFVWRETMRQTRRERRRRDGGG